MPEKLAAATIPTVNVDLDRRILGNTLCSRNRGGG
jgi:hypothetical protein